MIKRNKHLLLVSLLLVLCAVRSVSQIVEPVHWNVQQDDNGYTVTATIDQGWHLYDLAMPDNGPLPTVFSVGDEQVRAAALTKAVVSFDENFGIELSYYENEAVFVVSTTSPQPLSVRYMACNDMSCTSPITKQLSAGHELHTSSANSSPATDSEYGLWWIFLMGLIGGFLAIFTPCVWPIIPMTVSFFMKKNEQKNALRDAMLYGLAIIIIYVGLGLLITLLFGASALNSLATNAVVNLLFFALLVVFALSFFGAFEITLPSSWSTRLDAKAASTTGFLSILLMAFTLVIVSFSCTGPIIGTLLVEAAGRSLLAPTVGMLGFAIALALPFTLFAMFPKWMKQLPKSGGWMDSFKVVLAFLELALSLKFFSVADLAYGWHLLDREVFVALWIVIFALLGLYLLGVFHFRHEQPIGGISVFRFMLAVVSLSFAMYMVPGLFGAPLKAISAFAPPISTQDFVIGTEKEQAHLDDLDEALTRARAEHKNVLCDFSGYGCVNCRKMEAKVLSDEDVKRELQNFIVVTLMVDDKTPLEQPLVVEENGASVKLKTVGDRWSYVQRTRFGANAQPYYVVLNADNEMLGTPYSYNESVEDFLVWLRSVVRTEETVIEEMKQQGLQPFEFKGYKAQ
ncbi:MAG: thioredoxin family protein [Paludibacteraceae bacterium]|nr:thioredoxin family protein [Paludibacteraceae bacterium]